MPVRQLILIGPVLTLSACAWLPWHHRPSPPAAIPAAPAAVGTEPALPPVPARWHGSPPRMPVQAPRPSIASPQSPRREPAPVMRPGPEHATPGRQARSATSTNAARPEVLDLHGRVQLKPGPGQQVQPGELADTVVYFVPAHGTRAPAPRHTQVITNHRDFQPTALVVPLGSTVTYVNRDKVRHNVFSVTPGAAFNLGYQPGGTRDPHVFDQPGLVLVNCNVHRSMEMDVLVVPTPYAGRVAGDGRFVLHDVPAGAGTLVAWNPRARMVRKTILVPLDAPASLPLLAERPRVVTRIEVEP